MRLSMSGNPGDMTTVEKSPNPTGGRTMSFEPPVGVIGIGLMGQVFARRLVGAGFGVVGYDIDPQKSGRLEEFGAHAAASIAAVARAASPILLAVFDTDQVETVVEREILPALPPPG